MSRRFLFYALFFSLLVTGFIFALTKMVPGFGDVSLPVLSHVQPFSFINQNGQEITQQNVRGKVYVAEFFFTTCKGICPKMNRNMKKVYETFKDEGDFLILSHTVDPDVDNVIRLKRYADSLEVKTDRWQFLTGIKDSLYRSARVSYILDDPKNNNEKIENQFIHTQFFALVDKNGRVRKIYDGLKTNEIDELRQDVKTLLNESMLISYNQNLNDVYGQQDL